MEDGTQIAPSVIGSGNVASSESYNVQTNPPAFYDNYANNVALKDGEENPKTMSLQQDGSQNVREFIYVMLPQMTSYTWRFELVDGTEVAPEEKLIGREGDDVSRNAQTEPPAFYDGFDGKVTLTGDAVYEYSLDADKTKNVRTFLYTKVAQKVSYEWHFELDDGSTVAPAIKGLDSVGTDVSYDVLENPPAFYPAYKGKVQLLDQQKTSYTMTLSENESSNIYTFVYTTIDISVTYEWHFQLEDGTEVAQPIH